MRQDEQGGTSTPRYHDRDLEKTRLSRPKLGEDATRKIREAILLGEFAPGERLGPDKLAERYGVSAMPIREALVALGSEGLVEVLPRRGFRVAKITETDLRDNFAIHAYAASSLAKRAALHMSPDDLGRLKDIQSEVERVLGKDSRLPMEEKAHLGFELNHEFHKLINLSAPGDRLRWILRVTSREVVGGYVDIPGWLDSIVTEHPAIIEALEKRDACLAGRLMSDHVMHGADFATQRFLSHYSCAR